MAQRRVDLVQRPLGRAGGEPVVADDAADPLPVALLGIGLIVLAVRPPAPVRDAVALAPGDQDVIEELAAVIGVPVTEAERQPLAGEMDGGAKA